MRFLVPLTMSLMALSASSAAHSIYTGLENSKGELCCGGNDCGPVWPANLMHGPDGTMYVRRPGTYGEPKEGNWHPIRLENILPVPSPDSHIHVCIWGGQARCVLMPEDY